MEDSSPNDATTPKQEAPPEALSYRVSMADLTAYALEVEKLKTLEAEHTIAWLRYVAEEKRIKEEIEKQRSKVNRTGFCIREKYKIGQFDTFGTRTGKITRNKEQQEEEKEKQKE